MAQLLLLLLLFWISTIFSSLHVYCLSIRFQVVFLHFFSCVTQNQSQEYNPKMTISSSSFFWFSTHERRQHLHIPNARFTFSLFLPHTHKHNCITLSLSSLLLLLLFLLFFVLPFILLHKFQYDIDQKEKKKKKMNRCCLFLAYTFPSSYLDIDRIQIDSETDNS